MTRIKATLLPLIAQAQENTGEHIYNVLADSGYSSYENYEKLEEQNITAYIPDQEAHLHAKKNADPFDRSNFIYDQEHDKYICPQGKELHFTEINRSVKHKQQSKVYTTNECLQRPLKQSCTKGNKRYIYKELREPLREKVRQRLNTPHGNSIYNECIPLNPSGEI